MVFTRYFGFLHHLYLASHGLAAIWQKSYNNQNSKFHTSSQLSGIYLRSDEYICSVFINSPVKEWTSFPVLFVFHLGAAESPARDFPEYRQNSKESGNGYKYIEAGSNNSSSQHIFILPVQNVSFQVAACPKERLDGSWLSPCLVIAISLEIMLPDKDLSYKICLQFVIAKMIWKYLVTTGWACPDVHVV